MDFKNVFEKKIELVKGHEITILPLSLADVMKLYINNTEDFKELETLFNNNLDDKNILLKAQMQMPKLIKGVLSAVVKEPLPEKLPLNAEVAILTEAFKLTFGGIEEAKKFVESVTKAISSLGK